MDYSKLSDFEINAMVHFGNKPQFKIENGYASFLNDNGVKTGFRQFYYKSNFPDYCNNAADAWPIIHQNEINILWNWNEEGLHGATALPLYEYEHENALRAAMTVFLKMQGRANVQDNPT